MKNARTIAKRHTTRRPTTRAMTMFGGLNTARYYIKTHKQSGEVIDRASTPKLKKYYLLKKYLYERDVSAPHGADASALRQESRTMPKRERLTQKQPLEFSADQIAAAVRTLSKPGMLETYATQGRARVDQSWGYAADAETEFAPYRKLD